jgi:hypothetical protein
VSEREQFEVWAKSNGLDVLPAPHWANLTFQSLPTEDSWRGWQASRRAALEEAAQVAYAQNAIMATTTAQLIENAIRKLATETNNADQA